MRGEMAHSSTALVAGAYLRTREGHLMRAGNEVLRLLAENPEGLKFDRLSALAQ